MMARLSRTLNTDRKRLITTPKALRLAFIWSCFCATAIADPGDRVVVSANNERAMESPFLDEFEYTFPAMGSSITIAAFSDSEELLQDSFKRAELEAKRLEAIFTDYDSESELNHWVARAPEPQTLSEDLFAVIAASDRWYTKSSGAFDASVGSLTKMWRSSRIRKKLPSDSDVARAVEFSGWNYVHLDDSKHAASITKVGVKIDLGGIAAGYIVDAIYDVLHQASIKSFLINAGGDIRCADPPPGREGWRIEVAPIAKDRHPLRRIQLSNSALVTSGDLWQFHIVDGVRRSHIIDPKSGYGVPGPSVVAVVAPKCIDADAAATAISAMGMERGMVFALTQPDLAVLMVSRTAGSDWDVSIPTEAGRPLPLRISVTENFPRAIYERKN